MRVIVTGSRDWADRDTLRRALNGVAEYETESTYNRIATITVVHGACKTGADAMADEWVRHNYKLGARVERHPADWKVGKQAGHWRNQHMVNLGAELVLAFFQPGAANAGTADCVRRAEEAGIPVRRYPNDGAP